MNTNPNIAMASIEQMSASINQNTDNAKVTDSLAKVQAEKDEKAAAERARNVTRSDSGRSLSRRPTISDYVVF